MKINWGVRFKNKIFWITIVPTTITLIYAILGLFGVAPGITLEEAQSAGLAIITLLADIGIITDMTTAGVGDSKRAMGYTEPYREEPDGDRGGNTMSMDAWVQAHMGKAIDYDGVAGAQCVDLAKAYLDEVYGLDPFSFGGSARFLFERYNKMPVEFRNRFKRIANTSELIPQKGDICVWGSGVGGGHGHVAIATGEGDVRTFYSYDQNWAGKAMHRQVHDYHAFLGVLRPNVQSAEYYSRYIGTTNSLVDALIAIRADSSFSYRRKIAKANGISNYIGTAKQNVQLLNKLKAGTMLKP